MSGAPPRSRALRAPAGFTLIEMVVVLIIIGVGMMLVVPMVEGGFEAREVRRAARQIASTMHFCRGEAVALGQPQELIIDANENSIHTTEWGRWVTLTDRAVVDSIQGGNVVGDGMVQIVFYPNGSTTGADVVLAGRRDRRENRLLISLDPLLGIVHVGDAQ